MYSANVCALHIFSIVTGNVERSALTNQYIENIFHCENMNVRIHVSCVYLVHVVKLHSWSRNDSGSLED